MVTKQIVLQALWGHSPVAAVKKLLVDVNNVFSVFLFSLFVVC